MGVLAASFHELPPPPLLDEGRTCRDNKCCIREKLLTPLSKFLSFSPFLARPGMQ